MKIAFVSKVKEKDLTTLFPWAKKIVPAYGGYLVCDVAKVSGLQKEFVAMFYKEMQRQAKQEREREAHLKRMKKTGVLIPMSLLRRRRGMIHG